MNVVIMHTIIPDAEISNGNSKADDEDTSSFEVDEIIRHAQVLSANDPKRSEPIPAISPTLSPTLSAMTPGF
jgi:hypothetical protein